MISVENITKSYGSYVLFEGAGFKINPKERIGLVGRNGHGKTTLFRLIKKEELPDSGAIIIPKLYRIGCVEQHMEFTEDTVLKEGMKGLTENEKDHFWKVEKILAGLGFSQNDLDANPLDLSGGFQVRLNLAKVIVSEPDLLLLDEPTNYLDITSIRWVERFLVNWPHELMLITHDRGFMDKIVTHTLGIHRKKIRKIAGNTEKYYTQTAQDEEIYEKTRVNDDKRRKEIELFISRFRAKARLANMVQSRVKTLGKMEKKDKLERIKTLDFSFRSAPYRGKRILGASGISFSYDQDTPLISDLDITIGAGDRVCVIGKNGKGKTTLLKILAGTLSPQTGQVDYNPASIKGFFEQTNVNHLIDSRTIEEEILYSHHDIERQTARNICGVMMFEGDSALKKIGVLSGGEKSRVLLGKLLATPVNLLILDEPTNHLDMDSCDALLAALDSFEGAVVMVTHNEMFLHALAERLIVFQDDNVHVFEGTYQRFLEKEGWKDEKGLVKNFPASDESPEAGIRFNKKELRRLRSEIITEKSKTLKPLEQRIAKTENRIESLEKELTEYTEAMQKASEGGTGKKIVELSQAIYASQTSIDNLFDELEALSKELTGKSALFENRLKQLEIPEGEKE
ncbi:MAG: ABC-F family ATP-binding cassette domain-containing protein [Proteobacteria bacterium]|nr:ABC-F family ATP-binding cassette domain-containing protein [Pseudomonadota bacterium]MBU1713711.1 ABC-F family ATP-binding cassette domain-containing protein [Pseudomonadota bacterium]